MFKTIAEIVIAVVLLVATVGLIRQRGQVQPRHRGFDLLLLGFVLVTLAAIMDALEIQKLAGDNETLAELLLFVELIGGYLTGIVCAAVGLVLWLPALAQHQRTDRARMVAERALQQSARELTARNQALHLLTRLADRLPGSSDEAAIALEAVNVLLEHSNPPRVAFYLLEDAATLRRVVHHGFDAEMLQHGATLSMNASLSGAALRAGRLLISDDLARDDRLEPNIKAELVRRGERAALVIPLQFRDTPLGTINLIFPEPRTFSEIDLDTFRSIGQAVALALVNARHVAELQHHAFHDSLTSLPNRAHLHEAFQRVVDARQDPAERVGLVLLDLDRFKEINDALGHQLGDELLVQLGGRLATAADAPDLVCRLGGDEFAVVLPRVASAAEAERRTAALLAELRHPYDVRGLNLVVGASAGVAVYDDHGRDSHELLRCADVAMYQAKLTGKSVAVYAPDVDLHTPERLALIADLRRAIDEGQLELHYQPKFSLASGSLDGFEALVRWRHPQLGLLLPDRFIPLAELSDTIQALSCWVVDHAFAQQRAWREAGFDISMAINLSVRNLLNAECPEQVRRALREHRLEPAAIELELTETALMADPALSATTLAELAALGVRLVVDDFGTGYSSLAYLKRFPLHALKVDRSFVQEMLHDSQSLAIVRSTVHMARDLGLGTVAEGVEDPAAVSELRRFGCDLAQGFALGRPAAADACAGYLSAGCWAGFEDPAS